MPCKSEIHSFQETQIYKGGGVLPGQVPPGVELIGISEREAENTFGDLG